MDRNKILLTGIGFIIGITIVLLFSHSTIPKLGNVNDISYSFNSTTTDGIWQTSQSATTTKLLKNGYGQLGSIIVTGTAAAVLNCYDATSTREGGIFNATTTLAKLVPSVAAGTYIYNTVFNKGLLCEVPSGPIPVTGITWK